MVQSLQVLILLYIHSKRPEEMQFNISTGMYMLKACMHVHLCKSLFNTVKNTYTFVKITDAIGKVKDFIIYVKSLRT